MLENSLADFFIKPSDAPFCRNLKLEIMTYLVNAENINRILKEFKVDFFLPLVFVFVFFFTPPALITLSLGRKQTYVEYEDSSFVTATIQAIGRCASRIPEVTDRCLHGLMGLLSGTRPCKRKKTKKKMLQPFF